ncbi:PREDICTED: protein GPR107 isoform X1 [Camelina sativa]|uniref:Protein GPR107 isoform X1 n=1 Tax=Camelina sativa TaxID=90675 RepID=A0ABM0XT89_CAMSA|nr:PREDICTED: protein GPR107 isoform X1 [Camelina sativa]
MTRLPFITAVVVVVFLLSGATLTVAEIKSFTISDDSRPVIFFEKFGFTQTGHVTVSVSSVSVSSPSTTESSKLGFFVLTEESLLQVLLEMERNPRFCILDSNYILHLFTFRNRSQFDHSYSITSSGEYSIFFASCVPDTTVSMKIKMEMYNLDPNGSKIYLPPGLTQLPGLYLFFSLCYLTFFGLWLCFWYNNTQSIHLFMAALLLVKSLTLLCTAVYKHYVNVTGTAHGWNITFYVFQFVSVVLLFTVIVLIGSGWSFLQPKLQGKEKKLLMIVVPLQVLASIASIVIGETGPFIENWVTWNQFFLLADTTSCLAIVFAMVRSMCCLRETSKKPEGKAVKRFYVLVIVYLFFTRIVVLALKITVDYKYEWVSNAAEEIASLAFCSLMFYMFRPMEMNECLDSDGEEETAELSLKEQEFGL